jgi:hypothetical protein
MVEYSARFSGQVLSDRAVDVSQDPAAAVSDPQMQSVAVLGG